jgi:hypothetical protein
MTKQRPLWAATSAGLFPYSHVLLEITTLSLVESVDHSIASENKILQILSQGDSEKCQFSILWSCVYTIRSFLDQPKANYFRHLVYPEVR